MIAAASIVLQTEFVFLALFCVFDSLGLARQTKSDPTSVWGIYTRLFFAVKTFPPSGTFVPRPREDERRAQGSSRGCVNWKRVVRTALQITQGELCWDTKRPILKKFLLSWRNGAVTVHVVGM